MDIEKIVNLPFFFIIGRPRSGTTLLRTLLDAHPNVNIPLESPIFITLYNKYKNVGYWNDAIIDNICDDLKKVPKLGSWTINIGNIRKSLRESDRKLSFAKISKVIYYHYNSLFEKGEIQLLGDKNPPHTEYLGRLINIFPEAKFIYLQRDYRDQIVSMRKLLSENPAVSIQSYRWKSAYKNFINFKNKFPKNCIEIKYEDLTNNPTEILMKICSFLEIDYEPSMLDFYKIKEKAYSIYPPKIIEKSFKSLFHPISTKHIFSWKLKLTEKEIRIADIIAGKHAEITGYDRLYKSKGPLTYILYLPIIIYGYLIYPLGFKTLNSLPFKWNIGIRQKISTMKGRKMFKLKLYKDEN